MVEPAIGALFSHNDFSGKSLSEDGSPRLYLYLGKLVNGLYVMLPTNPVEKQALLALVARTWYESDDLGRWQLIAETSAAET